MTEAETALVWLVARTSAARGPTRHPGKARLWEALASLSAILEAGWSIVPAQPTREMQEAVVNALAEMGYIATNEGEAAAVCRAALAAAPRFKP